MSNDAKRILEKFGTFQLELRGDVELKGKGRVTTHWLLECNEPDPRPPTPRHLSETPESSPYPLLIPTNSCIKVYFLMKQLSIEKKIEFHILHNKYYYIDIKVVRQLSKNNLKLHLAIQYAVTQHGIYYTGKPQSSVDL